ncbi:MAG: hypothetical protein HY650_03980 [Acidobacteria bacterium]|nr:hypothetical protein [Acidobacteriota bacterium]
MPITPNGFESEEVGTLPCRSPAELRQQIAARLGDMSNAEVQKVSFRILANAQDAELSGYSSGVRGGLSGKGTLDVQIELTFPGPLTKAEVEARCEQLPKFPSGSFSGQLRVLRKQGEVK